MYEQIIKAATDLPVLVQGALGSALFASVVWIGQKLSSHLSSRATTHSKSRRAVFIKEEILKYSLLNTTDFSERGAYLSLLLFRALRNLIKALTWLTLGLAFSSIISVLGLVGYLGCLYYLFTALNTVKPPEPTESPKDVKTKLASLKAEREQLDKH